MSDSNKAVFLSYASQDAEAAKRICEALRVAGIEVWFDQSELVGGDAWDHKIRTQIKDCSLLIPIISQNTQSRTEGYFRLEWRLADQRTHLMAKGRPFLLPVVIDDTRDSEAQVPDSFTEVQWTKLPGGQTSAAFAARVQKLLGGEPFDAAQGRSATGSPRPAERAADGPLAGKSNRPWLVPVILGLLAVAALAIWQPWKKPEGPADEKTAAARTPVPLSEARKLVQQARALIDDDPLDVRESYKSAVELCERATQLSPDDGEAWATLARANLRLATEYREDTGKRRVALRSQIERAIRLAPDSIEAGLAMAGYELFFEDNVAAARARLLRLIERAPTDRRLLRMLVTLEEDRGQDVQEARRWTERANALPGGDAGTLLSLAWVHWGRNEFPQVREAVEKSLAIQPMTESCQLRLMLFNQSGDFEGARRFLREMPAAILREDRTALVGYQVQLFSGDYEGALRTITAVPREILEEGLFFSVRGYLAGNVLLLAGKANAARVEFGAALKALDERLAETPRDIRVVYHRAMVLARLGETAKAEQQLATARELGRDEWYEPDVCVLLGRLDEALASFARTIDRTQSRWPGHLRDLKYDPLHEPLRRTARGAEIVARGDVWLREMLAGGSRSAGAAPAVSPAPDKSAPVDKSVAVLAFANLSDDKNNEYFSDGISEELLNVLAKIPGLTVRGRSSGFYFKGKQAKSAEIGQQLNVSYLVQGSVRRAGDRVRISAQLIRAATDEVVWSSGSLDRDLKDIFAVQDEIAGLIAKNLSVSMGVAVRAPHQVNPEALTALLEGRHFWVLRTMEGFARAGEFFNRAVALDPDWAPAHAALAGLLTIEASYLKGGGESVSERFALAAREAKRAIELDPTLGEPHATLGKIAMEDRRLAEAEEEFHRALELEPNNALVLDWHGDLMVTQGRLDRAIAAYRRAVELEPLAPYILWDLAWELMHVRRYGEALALVERAAALTPPGATRLSLRRARLLLELGRKAEAEVALRAYLENPRTGSDPQFANEAVWCLQALGSTADRERWTAELLRQYPDSFSSGVILLMLGREEEAFALLGKIPPIFWQQLYWEPVFDPVRDTPRFQHLLEKLGCVAEYKVARETLARLLKEQEAKK